VGAEVHTLHEDVTKLSAEEIQRQLDQIRKAEALQISVTQVCVCVSVCVGVCSCFAFGFLNGERLMVDAHTFSLH